MVGGLGEGGSPSHRTDGDRFSKSLWNLNIWYWKLESKLGQTAFNSLLFACCLPSSRMRRLVVRKELIPGKKNDKQKRKGLIDVPYSEYDPICKNDLRVDLSGLIR